MDTQLVQEILDQFLLFMNRPPADTRLLQLQLSGERELIENHHKGAHIFMFCVYFCLHSYQLYSKQPKIYYLPLRVCNLMGLLANTSTCVKITKFSLTHSTFL